MPTPEQIRGAVDAYVAAYNANDRARFLDAFADDGVLIDPVGTPAHEGAQALGAFWDLVHGMTETIKLDPSAVHVCGGGEAAMVFRVLAGEGANGMVINAVETFCVDDAGKITLLKAYWDMGEATSAG
jgi:steroid delta-isomerase